MTRAPTLPWTRTKRGSAFIESQTFAASVHVATQDRARITWRVAIKTAGRGANQAFAEGPAESVEVGMLAAEDALLEAHRELGELIAPLLAK